MTWYQRSRSLALGSYLGAIFPTENSLPFLSGSFVANSLQLVRLLKLCRLSSKNSSLLMRSSLLTAHILPSRYFMPELSLYFSGTEKGVVLIFLTSSFSLLHYQGVIPTIISYRITPTAKISLYGEQTFLSNDYKGMQRGVPTLWRVFVSVVLLMEKPKSPIFHILPVRKILAGLMSRCSTPILSRYLTASTISPVIATASFSHNLPLLVIYSSKSPCGQYSVMRQQCVTVLYTFSKRMMLGCVTFLRIYISLSSISRLEEEYFLSQMTFMAYQDSLLMFLQRQTLLVQPEPISSRFLQQQWPTVQVSSLKLIIAFEERRSLVEPTSRSFLTSVFQREWLMAVISSGEQ